MDAKLISSNPLLLDIRDDVLTCL